MASIPGYFERRLRREEMGIADDGNLHGWPPGAVVLASEITPHASRYLMAIPDAALQGEALTGFLDHVAPFGCPPPGSLIRAYSLPDSPFPSILLGEHEAAPDGLGDAYRRFVARSRQRWLGALQGTGAGLFPALAWQAGPDRRFLATDDEWVAPRLAAPGVADDYLGRGLLLLAHPALAASWPTMMSLGGVTKIRKMTGREFPVWVDLPAHQPALLASPLLAQVERLV